MGARVSRDVGNGARAYAVDVSDPASVKAAVQGAARDLGRPSVVVTCAGIGKFAHAAEMPFEDWSRILAVNLTADFLTIKQAVKRMRKQHYGRIVNVSSIAAKHGGGYLGGVAYASTKAGVAAPARAAGTVGTIVEWDGTKWTVQNLSSPQTLYGVWASGPETVWAVGFSSIWVREFGKWNTVLNSPQQTLYAVAGAGDGSAWAVGTFGAMTRWAAESSRLHSRSLRSVASAAGIGIEGTSSSMARQRAW